MDEMTPTTERPHRSQPRPMSVVLAIASLFALGAVVVGVVAWRYAREKSALESLLGSTTQPDAGAVPGTAEDWTLEVRTTGVDTTLAALNAAAKQLSGDSQQVAQAAARVTVRLRSAGQDYTNAYEGFMRAGGIS